MRIEMIGVIVVLAMVFCSGKSESQSQKAYDLNSPNVLGDTIFVDTESSKIKWKGTKMRGLGKHEGTVDLKSGYLILSGEDISGGEFIIDMHSIDVTDIPEHEPVPRRNLINHLKSEDFFAVGQYPEAHLKLTSVESSLKIQGLLSMHGITNPIEFEASKNDQGYEAMMIIDRFKWNVAYEGSWIDRTLVDREIELSINLVLK